MVQMKHELDRKAELLRVYCHYDDDGFTRYICLFELFHDYYAFFSSSHVHSHICTCCEFQGNNRWFSQKAPGENPIGKPSTKTRCMVFTWLFVLFTYILLFFQVFSMKKEMEAQIERDRKRYEEVSRQFEQAQHQVRQISGNFLPFTSHKR